VRSIQHIPGKALIRVVLAGKHYTIHTFRHSFATHLLNQGTDLLSIKAHLGHASIAQTIQYLHLSNHHIQNVVCPDDLLQDISCSTHKYALSW